MDVTINFNAHEIIRINKVSKITTFSNQNIVTLFFNKKSDRDIAVINLNRCSYISKVTTTDNSEYKDLPECYKIYFSYDCNISVDTTEEIIDNPFHRYQKFLQDGIRLYVLLVNDTSTRFFKDMEVLDISDHNEIKWTDKVLYPNSMVTVADVLEDKATYIMKFITNFKVIPNLD